MKNHTNTLRKVNITLTVLLLISALALACVLVQGERAGRQTATTGTHNHLTYRDSAEGLADQAAAAPVTLTGSNVVTQGAAGDTYLTIYKNHPEDGTRFQVGNMFPGDTETKTYPVQVSYYGNITLRFHADIRSGYEKLAEVLQCKVVLKDTGAVLYEGLMKDMPASIDQPISSPGEATDALTYEISVSLDTSVGNEYQNKELKADFRWWVEETTNPESQEGAGEGGHLVQPPKTGDASQIILWGALAGMSLILILLLLVRRRKEEKAHEKA